MRGHVNSLERLIGILDIFEEQPGVFTAEQLHARLGYTRSTMYRYLKTLTDAGLLTSFHGTGFALGPRVIELNSMIVTRDPMIVASRALMMSLARQNRGTALLCRRFRDKVLCIHQDAAVEIAGCYYQVGIPRSLCRGAASRIILANMPSAHVRRLVEEMPQEFAEAGLGQDLLSVRRRLRRIRERGYDVSAGEVMPDVTAVAAPVVDGGANIIGSFCLSIPRGNVPEAQILLIAEQVMTAAESISHAIAGAVEFHPMAKAG